MEEQKTSPIVCGLIALLIEMNEVSRLATNYIVRSTIVEALRIDVSAPLVVTL